MYMDYGKFEDAMGMTAEVFSIWEENMKDFTNVAREGTVELSVSLCVSADLGQSHVNEPRSLFPSRSTRLMPSCKSALLIFEPSDDLTNSSE